MMANVLLSASLGDTSAIRPQLVVKALDTSMTSYCEGGCLPQASSTRGLTAFRSQFDRISTAVHKEMNSVTIWTTSWYRAMVTIWQNILLFSFSMHRRPLTSF